jgi:hypothetical protein
MTENKKKFEIGHYCYEKATNRMGVVLQNTGECVRVYLQNETVRTFKQGDLRWPNKKEREFYGALMRIVPYPSVK